MNGNIKSSSRISRSAFFEPSPAPPDAQYNQLTLALYLRWRHIMIFDSRASLLCRSINPVRFTLIMSTCHSVTSPSPPSTFPHTYAHPLMYLLSPSNHNPRRPVPKTHQSVGHSTKDDKGPAGIKWGNRDSKEVKDRKRKKRGEILSFSQRPPPLSTQPLGPWELRNDKRDRRKKKKK